MLEPHKISPPPLLGKHSLPSPRNNTHRETSDFYNGVIAVLTSSVNISVYDNKEAADRQLEGRRKHMEDFNVSDAFFHEGKVLAFYADNEQIDNLVKSVS